MTERMQDSEASEIGRANGTVFDSRPSVVCLAGETLGCSEL
jgi:hypothetical protein